MTSVEELRANLDEYRAQKDQVDELLELDDSNEEYQELHRSLIEVIELTEELLREALETQARLSSSTQSAGSVPVQSPSTSAATPIAAVTEAPGISTFLPPQVAQQIRAAQQKAALSGQAPLAWAIGARCQAVWSGDGGWYNGTISGVSVNNRFIVDFDEDGGIEEAEPAAVRQIPEEEQLYRGVQAPQRKAVADEPEVVTEIPKWLEIQPEDDEKTRLKKRKLVKSYKSKIRFQKLDSQQREKQSSWLNFQKGKGTKKKAGFFTGKKKGSMFSVPEGVNAKVGVIGSGKATTDYKPKSRHDFAATDAAE